MKDYNYSLYLDDDKEPIEVFNDFNKAVEGANAYKEIIENSTIKCHKLKLVSKDSLDIEWVINHLNKGLFDD